MSVEGGSTCGTGCAMSGSPPPAERRIESGFDGDCWDCIDRETHLCTRLQHRVHLTNSQVGSSPLCAVEQPSQNVGKMGDSAANIACKLFLL